MDIESESDDQATSSAATIEVEVQGECADACSICLDEFSQIDPSTVTDCKHEFHLHCILEWCHRSSNCPMCWQPISLRDEESQELLEEVEHERSLKANKSRNPTEFYTHNLPNFNLHLPTNASEIDLEEHIFQHLAAAAAIRSGHYVFQRGGQRVRLPSQGQPPLLMFSGSTDGPHDRVTSLNTVGGGSRSMTESLQRASAMNSSSSVADHVSPLHLEETSVHRVGSNVASADPPRVLSEARFVSQSSRDNQNTTETSEMQPLSESLRSRLNAWSMRYKESISRNTRGWKERLFPRSSTPLADLSSEIQREVNSGVAGISRMVERLDSRRNNRSDHASQSSHAGRSS